MKLQPALFSTHPVAHLKAANRCCIVLSTHPVAHWNKRQLQIFLLIQRASGSHRFFAPPKNSSIHDLWITPSASKWFFYRIFQHVARAQPKSKAHLSQTFHDGFKSSYTLMNNHSSVLRSPGYFSIYFTFIFVNLTRILFPSLQSLRPWLCSLPSPCNVPTWQNPPANHPAYASQQQGQGKATAGEFWHPESKTYQEQKVGFYTFLGLKLTFQ